MFEGGLVRLSLGRDSEKPVVRWLDGKNAGRYVPGSGVSPAHVDSENGRKGAYKQLPEYRALLHRLVEASDDAEVRGSFAWIVDQMFEAIKGYPVTKECPQCGKEVYMYHRPDTNAAKYLIDQVADKPTHRTEIDIESRSIHLELSERFDPSTLQVNRIDPAEERRRREALAGEIIDVEAQDVSDA